jgi:pseudo-rSAM protein
MKKYWLSIYPDVFLWKTQESILLYNSKNKQIHQIPNHPIIAKYVDELADLDHLYTIDISEEDLKVTTVRNWIDKIISFNFGQLTEQLKDTLKPVSFIPFFKLQNDINHIRHENQLKTGGNIIKNLHEIIVHLNGSDAGNMLYSKQTIYPINSSKNLPLGDLKNFIQSCKGELLNKINLVGNIISYPQFNELYSWLEENQLRTSVFLLASDWVTNEKSSNKIQSISQISIICDSLSLFSPIWVESKQNQLNINFIFPFTSEEEYDRIITETEKSGLSDYELLPLFNGDNSIFFEKYIYITVDDFKEIQLSKREIFAHQVLNTNFFGKLIILPEGQIYANLNHPIIGTIYDPIYNLLYKEMDEGTSWRMIRDKKPCSDCIYQWLCPSPSNYELVIGKTNLCHVNFI